MSSELAYDRKGAGEPVVLLHGIGHRRQAWSPIFDTLAGDYDVIAFDLAGFGQSPALPSSMPYDMDHVCSHLTANFQSLGIDRPHVVGNSLGGAIALELGARDAARSVTALSPAGFFGPANRFIALAQLIALRAVSLASPDVVLRAVSATSLGRRIIGSALYAHPERVDAAATLGDARAMKASKAFERVALSAMRYRFSRKISVPTTVVWGTRDRLLPYAQSATARERLPEAEHVGLVDAGHVPMVDQPDKIVRLISETIARSHVSAVGQAATGAA